MSIYVDNLRVDGKVLLAPMSGVTDVPFRALAARHGAGLVVTEMVASEDLATSRGDGLKRATACDAGGWHVVQLAGREARWMREGARLAHDLGADIIDINMGCPAKQVTGSLSGSALMRNLDHALELIDATVAAVPIPVTLKMRLGWDDENRNAPELARRAEAAGVKMITVHGRTRCQFYNGKADWQYVGEVKRAVGVPVIVNGDIGDEQTLTAALAQSGADGAMIGRFAYGRPWLPGMLSSALDGKALNVPGLAARHDIMRTHYEGILSHYGVELGVRCARKHLGWYVDSITDIGISLNAETAKLWRKRFCQEDDHRVVARSIDSFHETLSEEWAA
jgi:nifR3 family TIM-barrel protein